MECLEIEGPISLQGGQRNYVASAHSTHITHAQRLFQCADGDMSSAFATPMADQYILVDIEDGSGIHPDVYMI